MPKLVQYVMDFPEELHDKLVAVSEAANQDDELQFLQQIITSTIEGLHKQYIEQSTGGYSPAGKEE